MDSLDGASSRPQLLQGSKDRSVGNSMNRPLPSILFVAM